MTRIVADAREMYSVVRQMRRLSGEYRELARTVARSPSSAMPARVHSLAKDQLRQTVVGLQSAAEELERDAMLLQVRADWAVRAARDAPFRRTLRALEISGQLLDVAITAAQVKLWRNRVRLERLPRSSATTGGRYTSGRWLVHTTGSTPGPWQGGAPYSATSPRWNTRGGVGSLPRGPAVRAIERWESRLKWGGPVLSTGLTATSETLKVWDYSHLTRQEKATRIVIGTAKSAAVATAGAWAGGAIGGSACAATVIAAPIAPGCAIVGATLGSLGATWAYGKIF